MKLIEGKTYFAEDPFTATEIGTDKERRFSKKDTPVKLVGINNGRSIIEWQGARYAVGLGEFIKSAKESVPFDDVKDRILVKWITGSKMYGTNTEHSDTDYKGVYILPDSYYMAVTFDNDWEEIRERRTVDGKAVETTYYELRKYLRMLASNNPNIVESLDIPEDCLAYKHDAFDIITRAKMLLLTKKAHGQFVNYAMAQIRKATGQNKMQNMEKAGPMKRKDVLDFCYVSRGQGSVSLKERLSELMLDQKDCVASAVEHMPKYFAVYNVPGGLINDASAEIRISSVEIEVSPIFYMLFNEDAWSRHCIDFKRHKEWIENRNESRWVEVKNTNQTIDGKNMLHCVRLIKMAEDIGRGKGIITRREKAEIDYLKSIRKGDVSLDELVKWSKEKLETIEALFRGSDLPEEVSSDFLNELYLEIRSAFLKN